MAKVSGNAYSVLKKPGSSANMMLFRSEQSKKTFINIQEEKTDAAGNY